MDWNAPEITALIHAALEEDLGLACNSSGDLTASATVPPASDCRAAIFAKQEVVVAGLPLAQRVFHAVNPKLQCELPVADGALVAKGTAVLRVVGCARSVLAAERTALNFLAHLSGIATLTRQFVRAIEGTRARIRDTRKTTPLHRALEKYAVRMGGGVNHRFGLYDAMLIKENHIALACGVGEAVRRALKHAASGEATAVQVEVRNEAELREALGAGARAVLLDNQFPADAARLVQFARQIQPQCIVEISGGVNLSNVRAYAETGADFISVGALTHSAPAADFSLLIEK